MGDNGDVTSSITGDDIFLFSGEESKTGKRLCFFYDVMNCRHDVLLNQYFGLVLIQMKVPVHHQYREIPRYWEEPNDLKSQTLNRYHVIKSPIPSHSSTSVLVA